MATQCRAKQSKAMQSNAKQCKTMQSKAKQSKAMQSNAMQSKSKQSKAVQSKAKQRNAKQSNAMQSKAMQSNAMQCKTKRSNAKQCRAMQSRVCESHPSPGNGIRKSGNLGIWESENQGQACLAFWLRLFRAEHTAPSILPNFTVSDCSALNSASLSSRGLASFIPSIFFATLHGFSNTPSKFIDVPRAPASVHLRIWESGNLAMQSRAKQCKAMQSRAKQCRAMQCNVSKPMQSKPMQSKAILRT